MTRGNADCTSKEACRGTFEEGIVIARLECQPHRSGWIVASHQLECRRR